MIYLWARAFGFTQIIEAPIYRRLLGTSWTHSLLPTAITHPIVWFIFPQVGSALGLSWFWMVVLAEIFAWLVEAAFMKKKVVPRVSWKRALFASLVANGASLTLGLISRAVFGAP